MIKMLENTREIVRVVLEESEEARNSDWALINKVFQNYCETERLSLGYICRLGQSGITPFPSFESITRYRRYWQAKDPSKYGATNTVKEYRNNKESEMKGSLGYANN